MERTKRLSLVREEDGNFAGDGKYPKKAVLHQLGISVRDLKEWRDEPPRSLSIVALRLSTLEISRRPVYLRKQIAKMEAERDAVKRALAILARGN